VFTYIFAARVLSARDPILSTGILHIPDKKTPIFYSGINRFICCSVGFKTSMAPRCANKQGKLRLSSQGLAELAASTSLLGSIGGQ